MSPGVPAFQGLTMVGRVRAGGPCRWPGLEDKHSGHPHSGWGNRSPREVQTKAARAQGGVMSLSEGHSDIHQGRDGS